MRRSFFALLAFALLEASGGPVVWLGASSGNIASLSVPREWLDRSRVTADFATEGATLSNALVQVAGLAGVGGSDKAAVVVFCGPGDHLASVPLGERYAVSSATVNKNGVQTQLQRRVPLMDETTYNGRLNVLLDGLKRNYPAREVALVVLPAGAGSESANGAGLRYVDYASAARQAGNVWAVPVVDLSQESGTEGDAASGKPRWKTAWRGRKMAFLGDSITDARHIGCTSNYWNFLERDLGVVPLVYGINGHQWKHVYGQAESLFAAHPDDVDEIVVFAGTNDFNANVPLGDWTDDWTDGDSSFRGRIAAVVGYLKSKYPGVPIWLMTPIHRGYATFGASNVQPDETYANTSGLWIGDYVEVVKEAAAKYGARLIDLNADSGLYPLFDSHVVFFHDGNTDRLHPNTAGHERMAQAIERNFRAFALRTGDYSDDYKPFYKVAPDAAALSAASAGISSLAVALDSRTVHVASSRAVAFDSSGVCGGVIFVY